MKSPTIISMISAVGLGMALAQAEPVPAPPGGDPPRGESRRGPDRPMEKRTFLGIASGPVDSGLRAQLGLAKGTGLIVHHVDPDSPAAAILQPHDVLTRFDDQILVNPEQLAVLVENRKPAETVSLSVVRAGKEQVLEATLGEREMPVRIENDSRIGFRPWMGMNPGQGIEEAQRMAREAQERAQEELRTQREKMEGKLGELRRNQEPRDRPEPGRGGIRPEGPGEPGGETGPRRAPTVRNSTWVQDQVSINLVENADGRSLTITDGGTEVFRGPLNSDEDRAKIPDAYRESVERLEQQVRPGREAIPGPSGDVL